MTAPTIASSLALRLRCLAPRLHPLGEGPLYHLLCDLAAGAPLLPTLESYAALPADLIAAYGGDKLPSQIFVVKSS
jgi:hypothetical protein